jgi:F-type H+-transporting ATPase subunit delta
VSTGDDRVEGYARGLLEVARAEDALDAVGDELFSFARVFESSDELRQALTDQQLPAERRLAIVEELLGPRAHTLTTSLVAMVVAAGRARDLPRIADRLVEEAASQRQHVVAEVRSAVALDDEQRRRLAEALQRATGKDVEVKVVVDESVLGGLVARIGDTVIDGTVRRRLDQLKHAL